MQTRFASGRQRLATVGIIAAAAVVLALLWRPLSQVAGLALGAAALGFALAPLAGFYERRLPRPAAALLALLTVALMLGAALWLLLPALLREMLELARTLPDSIADASKARWQLRRASCPSGANFAKSASDLSR